MIEARLTEAQDGKSFLPESFKHTEKKKRNIREKNTIKGTKNAVRGLIKEKKFVCFHQKLAYLFQEKRSFHTDKEQSQLHVPNKTISYG